MLEIIFHFTSGLVIISIPCYAFYKAGMSAGIQRGIRRQILRELTLCGVIEQAEPNSQHHSHHHENPG